MEDLEKALNIQLDANGAVQKIRPKTNKLRQRQLTFLYGLIKTFGNVSKTAELTGIDRSCHYDWLKKYPAYKEQVEAVDDVEFDFVKNKALQRVQEGSDSMIQFMLRTKFKARGYADNAEISVPIPVTIVERRLAEGESLPEKPKE